MSCLKRLSFVRSVWADMLSNGGVEKQLFQGLAITEARDSYVIAKLTVDRMHTNRLGIMHGGVISTLVDLGGSLAFASRGYYMTGVTTDLNVSFLSSAGVPGNVLEIHSKCEKVGRTMAYTFVELRQADTQKLLARGSHTKFISSALDSPKNTKFQD